MLELIGLRRSFDDVVALDDVSFAVPEGRSWGSSGRTARARRPRCASPSGCSTPDAGEVRWRGEPSTPGPAVASATCPRSAASTRRCASASSSCTWRGCTGVPAGYAARRAGRDRGDRGLERSGRGTTVSNRSPSATSSACSWPRRSCTSPTLLVLDEPFSGLDPVGVDVLAGVLRRQAAEPRGAGGVLEPPARARGTALRRGRADRPRPDRRAGTIDELRASRARRLLRVEVAARSDGWYDVAPRASRSRPRRDGGVVLELDDDVDEQRVLDLARASGDVLHFSAGAADARRAVPRGGVARERRRDPSRPTAASGASSRCGTSGCGCATRGS